MTRTAEARPALRPRPRGWLGPLLQRLHFYAGILVGPFILVAATSGALYVISPQIEEVVYADTLHVAPSATTLSLGEQVEIAQAHVDGQAPLSAIRPAPEPGDTTRVMFAQEGLGESESRAIFIDPGTGEIRGDLTVYGTSGSLPLRSWIDHLHRGLHLGDVGRLYSELAASWLWIVASAGLALWIVRAGRTRIGRHREPSRPRAGGRRRLLRWHTVIGSVVLLAALFLSATGITWSQHAGANVTGLRASLGWATPAISASLGGTEPAADEHAEHSGGSEHAGHHSGTTEPSGAAMDPSDPMHVDHVLEVARGVNIDSTAVEILPPAQPGTAWVVQEIHRSYPTEVDVVAIDGTTLEVVDRVDFADYPLMAKLARWGVDIHMGTMFGLVNQIVLFLVAMGIASMVVLGYAMWWRRRPRGTPRLLGCRAPRRGALRAAPWWGLAAVGAVAVAIGLVLPLVGWTLLGFLAVDLALALRPARAPATSPR
ncbi:PepSY-associated TM helix domain-containing protein [Brachybacterium phenoliresistens]|uniref:PepSY-associated TM helix domain-containing protein n=1 Tax=Brachybacterium phenoliresistens TaxID=396014 RepID=UPI0031DF9665